MGLLNGPTNMSMDISRKAVSRDTDSSSRQSTEAQGRRDAVGADKSLDAQGRTRAEQIGAIDDAISFDNKAVQSGFGMALGMLGPVSSVYGAVRTGLGAAASLASAIDEGMIGDMLGTREREAKRDAVEAAGMDSKGAARIDNKSRAMGMEDSAFGLSAAYGSTTTGMLEARAKEAYGDTGLKDVSGDIGVDPIGADVSASNIGKPGFDFGVSMADIDTSLGSLGSTKRGGYSAGFGTDSTGGKASEGASRGSLGDKAGYGATKSETAASEMSRASGDSGRGSEGSSSGGGHGARGGGNEGDSSPGGIGGY